MDLLAGHEPCFVGQQIQCGISRFPYKSAIYHHFRTREELLSAVIEPMVMEVAALIVEAETHQGRRVRADLVPRGYAALAASNRELIPLLTGDPSVVALLRTRTEWGAVVQSQLALLADVESGLGGQVKAALVMSGIASAAGVGYGEVTEDVLRDELIAAGRKALGLRVPHLEGVTS